MSMNRMNKTKTLYSIQVVVILQY